MSNTNSSSADQSTTEPSAEVLNAFYAAVRRSCPVDLGYDDTRALARDLAETAASLLAPAQPARGPSTTRTRARPAMNAQTADDTAPATQPDAVLLDQIHMPGYNPAANSGRGDWGLRDVTDGGVYAHPVHVVACAHHGAMNSVSPNRTLCRFPGLRAGRLPRPALSPAPSSLHPSRPPGRKREHHRDRARGERPQRERRLPGLYLPLG